MLSFLVSKFVPQKIGSNNAEHNKVSHTYIQPPFDQDLSMNQVPSLTGLSFKESIGVLIQVTDVAVEEIEQ